MSYFTRIFLQHPNSVGEGYLEHFYEASLFGIKLVAFGVAEFVHAVVPSVDLFHLYGTESDVELFKLARDLRRRRPIRE